MQDSKLLLKKYRLIIFDWEGTLMAADQSLYPEVKEVLTGLKSRGYLLGIATNRSRRSLNELLRIKELASFFDASCCADEVFMKPHPGMIITLLNELAIDPAQAIMIGDSEADMLVARNAGIDAIAVAYSGGNIKRLLTYHPLTYLDDFRTLLHLFPAKGKSGQN